MDRGAWWVSLGFLSLGSKVHGVTELDGTTMTMTQEPERIFICFICIPYAFFLGEVSAQIFCPLFKIWVVVFLLLGF